MRSALDHRGNAWAVEALQALHDAQREIPDLVCDHPPCGCAVRFVHRYQQNRSNRIEPIDVPAYIGLTSDSEHVAGCRYDAPGRLTAIVAQSDPDFVKALDTGKRELRLLVLHNGLRGEGLSGTASVRPGTRTGTPGVNATIDVVQSEKRLSSYVRTMADLVALRALCEADTFLASELVLRFGTRRIAWKDFFFERERYDEAWALVREGGTNAFPIALAATVRSHYVPSSGGKYRNAFLNCESLYRKTGAPDRVETFEVSVAHQDANWLSDFPVGTDIVMFGIWRAQDSVEKQGKDSRDPSKAVTFVTHKLMLEPKFRRQVTEAED
ncbi:hypothetical protein [Burkholderia pseudomultivorans]|uniref:hypothetical protein n=1 Tax=Burkholderia pseudomultivorans TaxID=1207504 RepID=UPI000AD2B96D|nr:hypothetical protein [Burkholderia pseudomultivorans]